MTTHHLTRPTTGTTINHDHQPATSDCGLKKPAKCREESETPQASDAGRRCLCRPSTPPAPVQSGSSAWSAQAMSWSDTRSTSRALEPVVSARSDVAAPRTSLDPSPGSQVAAYQDQTPSTHAVQQCLKESEARRPLDFGGRLTDNEPMKSFTRFFVAALVIGAAGCGSGMTDMSSPPVATGAVRTLADAGESDYLLNFARGKVLRPALVPADSGLLVVAGSPEGADGAIAPVSNAVVIGGGGTVTELPDAPGPPLADVSGSAFHDQAYLVGTKCPSGEIESETGVLHCSPGNPVLLHLDLGEVAWSEIDLPPKAAKPAGFLGDQAVFALKGAVVYQVYPSGGRPQTWATTDQGKSWQRLSSPMQYLCAANGVLLGADTPESNSSTGGAIHATGEADQPLRATARILDTKNMTWGAPTRAPEHIAIVDGSPASTCVADVGLVMFVQTGGIAGSVITFSPGSGWKATTDPEGARLMEALPSNGSGILIPQIAKEGLVRMNEDGTQDLVDLPEGAIPIAGIGHSVFIITDARQPMIVPD